MIRLLIADDHDLIRKGLKQLLAEEHRIVVAGEASSSQEVLHLITRQEFDLLLLDINLHGQSGLDILTDIKRLRPGLPVLILSIYEDDAYIIGAINKGANGYISKSADSSELIRAIERVAKGEKYISGELAGKVLFVTRSATVNKLHTSLTPREMEILKRIASGTAPRQIAQALSISVKTVQAHREHILRKMNMRSNAEMIRYAVRENLI